MAFMECDNAFDGITDPGFSQMWSSSDSDGGWLQRDFAGPMMITHVIVWNECNIEAQSQTLTFSFSDGTTIQVDVDE